MKDSKNVSTIDHHLSITLTKKQQKELAPIINKVGEILDENTGKKDKTSVMIIAQIRVPVSRGDITEPTVYALPLTGVNAEDAHKHLRAAIEIEIEKEAS